MEKNDRMARGKVKGEYLRELVRMEYARCLGGKYAPAEKMYVNKKTNDKLAAGRNRKPAKDNIVEFPNKNGKKR